jgi:hypothetical protein
VAKTFSVCLDWLFSMSISSRLIGNTRALLPFSGAMRIFFRSKSMSLHFSLATSPHLAPVSYRNWGGAANILPLPEISYSMSASVGSYLTLLLPVFSMEP